MASDRVRIGSSRMGMISGGDSTVQSASCIASGAGLVEHHTSCAVAPSAPTRRWPQRWNDVEDFVGFIVSPATASAMDRFVNWLCGVSAATRGHRQSQP